MFNIDDKRMSFTEHLGELRTRLIRVCVCLIVTFFAGWFLSEYLLRTLQWPINTGTDRHNAYVDSAAPKGPDGKPVLSTDSQKIEVQWVTLTPQESFTVYLRLSMYFAMLISFPVILFQICAFIFPGLKSNERGLVVSVLAGASVLAIGGTLTGYLGVLPFIMPYLLQYNPPGNQLLLQLAPTITFILVLLGGFIIAFQFPMFVLVAVVLDLVSVKTLTQYRRHAIVGIAIVAAVLTPPDPLSMSVMMCPLLLLYEASILAARVVTWRRARKAAEETTTA